MEPSSRPVEPTNRPMERSNRPRVAGASRTVLFTLGAVLVVAAFGLGAVIFTRDSPFGIDTWWNDLMVASASPILTGYSRVFNVLGGTWFGVLVVPILGAIALIVVKRPWSAAYFLTAEAASAGMVQILKHLFGRVRPEEIIVISDYGSFPSGHVANAATITTVAFLLFPRLWVLMVGIAWVFLMALSRTALHAHWLSDTLGGALVGIGVALIVAGFFAPMLQRERPAAQPAPLAKLSE